MVAILGVGSITVSKSGHDVSFSGKMTPSRAPADRLYGRDRQLLRPWHDWLPSSGDKRAGAARVGQLSNCKLPAGQVGPGVTGWVSPWAAEMSASTLEMATAHPPSAASPASLTPMT